MSEQRNIQLDESWLSRLAGEFDKDYMVSLRAFLAEQKSQRKTVYPPGKLIFNALNTTAFDQVKVVILGQDPYHGPGQAHGLCFSVPEGVQPPPSLVNIFKEIESDIGGPIPQRGCLQSWAEQGVLLLNSVLTVEHKRAGSHANQGWEQFTDAVIDLLNREREGLVFMLWGSYAHKKGQLIDTQKHRVLKSVHPSPLSAHRGFFGCKHFSQANHYLQQNGSYAINWAL